MGHVVRKDQETLHEACQKHHDHREGDVGDQRSEPPTHRDKRGEGQDGRDRGRKHRGGHAARRVLGGGDGIFAQRPVPVIRVFAHDDRVVDHDPQRDDQREERDHVERQSRRIHQRDGRDQRHGDAGGDPEGRARVQEQEQKPHHKREAHKRVVQKDVEAARDRLGAGPDQVDGSALGKARLELRRDVLDQPLDGDGVPVLGAVDADRNSRILAHEIGAVPVGAAHLDPGDVTDGQRRTVVIRPEGEGRDPLGAAGGGPGAHAGAGRVDLACGGGVGGRRNHGGDLGHGNVVADQRGGGHLDHDLRRRDAADGGPRDARIEETRDELVREPAKLVGRDRAGDHHVGYPVPPRAPAHRRRVGALGKVGDAVDGDLHLVGGARHVPAGFELDLDGGAPLATGRRGRGDARHGHQHGLQHRDDRGVHVLRPGAVPTDLDVDLVGDHVGEELRPHLRKRGDARNQHQHQQEVRRGAVAGEIAQDAGGLVGECAHDLSFPCALRCARPSARAPRARSVAGSCGCAHPRG